MNVRTHRGAASPKSPYRTATPECAPAATTSAAPEDYDRALCLLPTDVLDFVLATQPKQWQRLSQHHGAEVRQRFLKRLSSEIDRRGALDVLRRGVKDMGCSCRLAYFRPASGLNEETRRLHAANFFAVARQIRYSTRNERSLDMVLFLNGLPVFTAELKNQVTGQTVEDAIRQYKTAPRLPRAAARLWQVSRALRFDRRVGATALPPGVLAQLATIQTARYSPSVPRVVTVRGVSGQAKRGFI